MSMRSEVARIRRRFRCLRGWSVRFDQTSKYKGQCSYDRKSKQATVYDFPGNAPADYPLHEILHIAFEAFRDVRGGRQRRQFEEDLIQDICGILDPSDD